MQKAADILYLLSTFSIRTRFLKKAVIYSKVGYKLFPNDIRLVEIHAYALLLQGEFEAAENIIKNAPQETDNIYYLRSKTAMLLQLPKDELKERIRKYLTM